MASDQPRNDAPAAFVEQIKDALEHLYDLPYLQQLPLSTPESAEPAGLRLRRELAAAIDRLAAGGDPSHSAPARFSQILRLHYLEGLTVQETATELDLSIRQAFRDLRRAEQNLAALLWPRLAPKASVPASTDSRSPAGLDEELDRIELHPTTIDARTLVSSTIQAVTRLAGERQIEVQFSQPAQLVPLCTDAALARQVLIQALSHVLQHMDAGALSLLLADDDGTPQLVVSAEDGALPSPGQTAEQLAGRLGWSFRSARAPHPSLVLQLSEPGKRLLIIDDNQGLLDLLHRYLTGHACQMTGTRSSAEGLRLAAETKPDAIVVDIMMPDLDGWEVLQRLRADPRTSAIPVIVCSVLADPGLAHSLGAALCLRKPIDREDFLAALRELALL